jgi:hypothetical protein
VADHRDPALRGHLCWPPISQHTVAGVHHCLQLQQGCGGAHSRVEIVPGGRERGEQKEATAVSGGGGAGVTLVFWPA